MKILEIHLKYKSFITFLQSLMTDFFLIQEHSEWLGVRLSDKEIA
jgi:hypothetical protein